MNKDYGNQSLFNGGRVPTEIPKGRNHKRYFLCGNLAQRLGIVLGPDTTAQEVAMKILTSFRLWEVITLVIVLWIAVSKFNDTLVPDSAYYVLAASGAYTLVLIFRKAWNSLTEKK